MANIMNNLLQPLIQDWTTILLAVFTFALLYLSIINNRKPARKLPPGPLFRWPTLGNLPSLDPKEPYKTINQLTQKYGPVYRLQFGSFPVLILNDFESVRQAFLKQGAEFDDRPKILVLNGPSGKGLVRAHSSMVQRIRRRFALTAFRDLGMGKCKLEDQIAEEIQRLCNVISKHEGKEFSPFHCLEMTSCNVIWCLIFGHGFAYDDPKLLRILNVLVQILKDGSFTGVANFVPWMRYLPFSGFDNVKRLSGQIDAFCKEMIDLSRENYTRGDPCTSFIETYLDNQENIKEETPDIAEWFDDEDFVACVGDLFGAATETTSTTLKWGFLYMVLQPDIQEKVQAELDSVAQRNRMPSLKDRPQLPYTEATLLEIQRIGSVAPLGVPRATTIDTKLCGFDIPQGTMVIPNLSAIHHDERIWKEAESFKPERFLDSDGKVNRREELIPFSIGKRKCLGEQLALMELFLIFTHLLHKFSFRLPEGAQPSLEPEMGMTLVPEEYRIVAVPRY
ncbi:cytochrome P450 2U1-like [Amphiura filiformis]|uniref:cytochrome P450 2U1-like n=1 Tax=Amphiura filiformis TaxID=82378 RepID=UPI003B2237DA